MRTLIQMHRVRGTASALIDWVNLTLGVGLAASPWVALGDSYDALLNAFACGVAVALAAAFALVRPSVWAERIIMAIGIWLLIAPSLLGFVHSSLDTGVSLFTGLAIAGSASFQVSPTSRQGQR